ncbi:hypothetical protein [Streptacidiphilus jiangxiensis]|uniref:Uncharacterized protein n=1 Tax=Streptacidiphilus jiangxiensis TaxID=235985 RepID=A0A1H7F572_STRJI|nr:hypothetical protein [Streptacidiphilus jiangxiensis]SEK21273.1 hypothetical protein SAMN05414137_10199 [Streptacidiphilus jiangxiensis]
MNHRRPNPDELTPDDLFRPDDGPTAAYGAPLQEPEVQAAATQYLPPMPAAPDAQSYPSPAYGQPTQPVGQGYGAPGFPQQTQPFAQQAQPTQQYGGYQQNGYQQGGQGGYEQGGYEQGGYEQYDDRDSYDEDPHRNRPSMRTLGIAVVAVCALAGIGLGALLSSGSSGGAEAGKGAKSAKHGATAAANPGDKAAQLDQAKKLSALLETASSNRSAVVAAVANVSHCQALPQAQQTLTQAAQARASLVTQLGQLQFDALPSGQELVNKLTAGWQASQQADEHYAAWAQQSIGICQKKHHPKEGGDATAAQQASSTATLAKSEAADLWNHIATANGLPPKDPHQL